MLVLGAQGRDPDAVAEAVHAAVSGVALRGLDKEALERCRRAKYGQLLGSLDSFAGTVKRAPKWMIAANLEWLYRLYKEPKRFGRMLRLPKYLWAVVCKRIRG